MGCDMTSQFLGYGKKTAWAAWTSIPDLTDTLAALAHDPDLFSLRSVQVHRNERFTVLMYRKGCGAFSVSQARFHLFSSRPRSGELRTQKLKSYLVRTQSLNVRPLKPGVGQYIAIHAMLTARDFFLVYLYPSGPFTGIFFQNLSRFFPVLAVANTGSCVGPQNKIGHPV